MKPRGKALKAALFNRDSAQQALDELLRAYHSTPHPATGEAPGNILLRNGYRCDYPRQAIDYQAVEESIQRDRDQKLARREEVNESRRRKAMEVSVGDEVLLRHYPKGRKFDPLYEDDIYEVVAVEDKGVTVKGEGGKLKCHFSSSAAPGQGAQPKPNSDASLCHAMRCSASIYFVAHRISKSPSPGRKFFRLGALV